uniref:Uncharacterized protein n=1 Tax=Arundo donax TaxID=35708 RepID=A0A0A9APR4_ARUDO
MKLFQAYLRRKFVYQIGQ